MTPLSCSRCGAPLSPAAAAGQAPCASCGNVNPAAGAVPFVNPYGPQLGAQAPMFGGAQAGAPPWSCFSCRHQNEGRYEFCLGCGSARRGGGGAEGGERREGYEGKGSSGGSQGRGSSSGSVVMVLVIVGIVLAIAFGGGIVALKLLAN